MEYVKHCIQEFENVSDGDSDPVSWVMRYAYSGITANLYTHRQRGLGRIAQATSTPTHNTSRGVRLGRIVLATSTVHPPATPAEGSG